MKHRNDFAEIIADLLIWQDKTEDLLIKIEENMKQVHEAQKEMMEEFNKATDKIINRINEMTDKISKP